jgi:hypothetical protein
MERVRASSVKREETFGIVPGRLFWLQEKCRLLVFNLSLVAWELEQATLAAPFFPDGAVFVSLVCCCCLLLC